MASTKKFRFFLFIVAGLTLLSIILQYGHRRQLIMAFDVTPANYIGDHELSMAAFMQNYDGYTRNELINSIQRFLVPVGPIFYLRNKRTIERISQINKEYDGKEIDDTLMREAVSRMSKYTLSPL